MENHSNYTSNRNTEGSIRTHGWRSNKWVLPAVLTVAVIAGFLLFMNTTDDNLENIEPASGYSSTVLPENMDRQNVDR